MILIQVFLIIKTVIKLQLDFNDISLVGDYLGNLFKLLIFSILNGILIISTFTKIIKSLFR